MVTGHDSVMIARSPAGAAMRTMLDGMHRRWPAMLVGRSASEAAGIEPFLPWPEARTHVPPEAGELYVARDPGMEQDWDDHGYDLGEDGEGPFAVLYRPAPRATTQIRVEEDPYGDRGLGFVPHEAVLVTAGLSLITIVTPDRESPFSRDLRDRLARALSG